MAEEIFLSLMTDENDTRIHHIILVDIITENYVVVRTLKGMNRMEAAQLLSQLANSNPQTLHEGSQELGKLIDAELAKFDRESIKNKQKE